MIRLLSALSLTAVFMLQAAPAGDSWSRVAALYHQRLQQTGIVGSSLMFVNTDVSSKRDPRHTTRAVDNDLRDAIAREFWPGAGAR